jgi:cysteine desulfurase / selenocysteine lyase
MSSLEKYFSDLRSEFPALEQKIYGKRLAYLDSAATSLKPQRVADRVRDYYLFESANVHRGAHFLSDQGTRHYEEGRETVAKFLNAKESDEIVFVKGATEGINLVAHSYAGNFLKEGDEILLTDLEHHANIVPWQLISEQKKLHIKVAESSDAGELNLKDYQNKLNGRVKMVAITGSSNTLGVRPPIQEMIKMAHAKGAKVLIDAAQLVTQKRVDVQDLDCDFLVFSAHKIFGPTGVGVLYGKKELLEKMPPYQGGGNMIVKVCYPGTTFNDVPFRFEAGTPHIEGVIGMKTALDFFMSLDLEKIKIWESDLLQMAQAELQKIPGMKLYGVIEDKGPIVSFNLDKQHHSDVASIVDHEGVAVRAGHHCTQPLMARLGVQGTLRASLSIYSSPEDVHQLVKAVRKAQEMLS